MHKFYVGQQVQYYPPRGMYAPRGAYIVTLKLPERDGQYEYRIRNMSEQHERMAREGELKAVGNGESRLSIGHKNSPGVGIRG